MNSANPADWPDQGEMIAHMPFLEELASKAAVILELGVGHGNGSTRAFARGLAKSSAKITHHISVDIDHAKPDCKPDEAGWSMIWGSTIDPKTVEVFKKYIWDRDAIDILFIDTDHTYEQMKAELELWSPFAGPNTTWVFHDTWMFDCYNTMTDAIKEFCVAHPEWEFIDYTKESHGLGLMKWTK